MTSRQPYTTLDDKDLDTEDMEVALEILHDTSYGVAMMVTSGEERTKEVNKTRWYDCHGKSKEKTEGGCRR